MTENHPPFSLMTHEEFIAAIGQAVQKLAPDYGISVCSPVIAQAILESAWGTSSKAARHNYFGLKYRAGRLTCHSGTFVDGSAGISAEDQGRRIRDQSGLCPEGLCSDPGKWPGTL